MHRHTYLILLVCLSVFCLFPYTFGSVITGGGNTSKDRVARPTLGNYGTNTDGTWTDSGPQVGVPFINDFGLREVRATDGNVPGEAFGGDGWSGPIGWWINYFSVDDPSIGGYYFYVPLDNGEGNHLFILNTQSMQTAPVCSTWTNCVMPYAGDWSFVTPGLMYYNSGTKVLEYNYDAGSSPLGSVLWQSSFAPTNQDISSDPNSVELGVRFYTDVSGSVTGITFYKGSGNTGTHVGHLWDGSGNLLGSCTFTNETASGWQTCSFSSPITVSADTLYTASYYAPNGNYADDEGVFKSQIDVTGLHGVANGSAAPFGNSPYYYPGNAFPKCSGNTDGHVCYGDSYYVSPIFSFIGSLSMPTISSLGTNSGPTSGGTSVTITGTNLAPSVIVQFGGSDAASTTWNSPTSVTAVTPGGVSGAVDVSVTNVGVGTATDAGAFTYTGGTGDQPQIVSATTDPGAANQTDTCVNQLPVGATQMCTITITGSNFDSGATVKIGTSSATGVTTVSSTEITAIVPTGAAETYQNVTVTNPGGLSATLNNGFFYGKIIWSDGLQNGNFNAWNGSFTNTGGAGFCIANSSGVCQTGTVHSGADALGSGPMTSAPDPTPIYDGNYVVAQVYSRASAGQGDSDVYMVENFSPSLTHYFVRWREYFKTANNNDTSVERKLYYGNVQTSHRTLDVPVLWAGNQPGQFGWFWDSYVNGSFYSASDNTCYSGNYPPWNTWYEIETEVQANSTSPLTKNGYANSWLNGAIECHLSNTYTYGSDTQGLSLIDFGQQISSGDFSSGDTYPFVEWRFLEDEVVADAYIP